MNKYSKCTLDSNSNLRDGEIITILPTCLISSQRNRHVLPFHIGIVSNKSHSCDKQLRCSIVLKEVTEARCHPSHVITCGTRPFDIDPIKFEVVVADRRYSVFVCADCMCSLYVRTYRPHIQILTCTYNHTFYFSNVCARKLVDSSITKGILVQRDYYSPALALCTSTNLPYLLFNN